VKRGGTGVSESGPKLLGSQDPATRSAAQPPAVERDDESSDQPPAAGRSLLDWGSAGRTLAGESVSGDRALVRYADHLALAAVIDGVGHGEAAARAAEIAAGILVDHRGESPIALFARCDAALERTRGVVMSLAVFDGGRDVVTWAGVGNVEGVLLRWNTEHRRESETLLRRVGVVGTRREQRVYAETVPLEVGDTLLFATDGLRGGFELGVRLEQEPKRIAERILAESASNADDALVLVARYLGRAGVPPARAPSPRALVVSGAWPRFSHG
jgi:negative regulator of sigma-B (phosphoserine phosphatase)